MEVVGFSGFNFREGRHKDVAVIWMDFKDDHNGNLLLQKQKTLHAGCSVGTVQSCVKRGGLYV